jgi:hypothetical protein
MAFGHTSRVFSAVSTRLVLACSVGAMLIPLSTARAQPRPTDFLFGAPLGTVSFVGGFADPRASSEVFSYTRELLTLNPGDFSSVTFGMEYARSISDRIDLFGGLAYSGSSERSEFRDWVHEDDTPIEQDTRFSRLPLTAGARVYLLPRGRSIGNYAWLPNPAVPFVSAGLGVMWYSFTQSGEFVDVADSEIFVATLRSSGWAPLMHAGAGLDFAVTPNLLLSSEARYHLASAGMQEDFTGFDKIDLSGLNITFGLKVRF